MAKITPSAIVGRISGSIHSEVYSRNRYGAYVRARTIPTNPATEYQQDIRAIFGYLSAAWRDLTDSARAGWNSWAQTNPITDRLGERQVLTGHVAYVSLNHRLLQAGDTVIGAPPVVAAPAPLTSLTLSADIGVGDFTVAFTATPLGAGDRLYLLAAVVDSPARSYVKNLYKLVAITAKAQVSPYTCEADVVLRFGDLAVGQKVVVQASVLSSTTGLLSLPLRDEALVVSTGP